MTAGEKTVKISGEGEGEGIDGVELLSARTGDRNPKASGV